MQVKQKILVDQIAGAPLVFVLNQLTRITNFIFQKKRSFAQPPHHIAVCKFMGMGSIIQSTALLQTLKRNFPSAQITFVTTLRNRELIQNFPFVDDIETIDDSSTFSLLASSLSLLHRLRKRKIDWYFDLEIYSHYSTLITALCLAKKRLGYYHKESNVRLGAYTDMVYFNTLVPVSQVYLQMARVAGCREMEENLYSFKAINETIISLKQKLNIHDGEKYALINPNASDLRIERRWDADNFIRLIRNLADKNPACKFILIGAANEQSHVRPIYSALINTLPNRIIDSSGVITVTELIALINNCQLIITNDTGPMHIAFALNKKTVALFGPCSPQQYVIPENVFCIYKNLYCSPCVHHFHVSPCKGDNQCMKRIEVDEVTSLCSKILDNAAISEKAHTLNQAFVFSKMNSSNPLGSTTNAAFHKA